MKCNNRLNLAFATLTIAHAAIVASTPRRVGDAGADVGIALWNRNGCAHCHEATSARFSNAPQAPDLSRIGARRAPAFLKQFLGDPALTRHAWSMPDLLNSQDATIHAAQASDLVQYLSTQGGPFDATPSGIEPEELERGRVLYSTIGCAACHPANGGELKESTRTNIRELTRYLINPLESDPSGRMPSMNLNEREAREIAVYLLKDQLLHDATTASGPGLKYQIFTGEWASLPDFGKLKPALDGVIEQVGIPKDVPADHFGIVLKGAMDLDAGKYSFYLTSDDGSRLFIDDKLAIDNDGVHATVTKWAALPLTKGPHSIRIEYFENDGGEELRLEYKPPKSERRDVPPGVFSHAATAIAPPNDNNNKIAPDAQAAARGLELFNSSNCAACHRNGGVSRQTRRARPLAALDPASKSGCITINPGPGVPRFAFDETQKQQIRAAIQTLRDAPAAPADEAADTIRQFDCTRCHERAGAGRPEESKLVLFTTRGEAEMGDEGRIPPRLDGVGRKLKKDWIAEVLSKGGAVRPYMATRMPQFGVPQVARLADLLPLADGTGNSNNNEPEFSREAILAGRDAIDAGAFSCISCHKLAGNNSLGIPAYDLANTTRRIRYEWFREYLLDPGSYRPGTRMPQFWPDGRSVLKRVLDGNTQKQIEALWIYFSLGDAMPLPRGLKPADLELRPTDGPLLFRTFFKDVGPRAICIGFPEGINAVFDLGSGRIAKLWKGKFINASAAWVGRAGQFAEPLGTSIVELPRGPVYAMLPSADAPWPGEAAAFKMGSYNLSAGFAYDTAGSNVNDTLSASIGNQGAIMTRHIKIPRVGRGAALRLAVAPKITALENNIYEIDGPRRLRIGLGNGARARIRQSGGAAELIVDINDGSTTIADPFEVEVTYDW
ncbi:MAG: c-type cytochrome [Planctomycetes bacterium]|nr:c-type cytochrome [Planctomycetota bacterium]